MANRKKFFASLMIFGLCGQVAWTIENMYFNVFMYQMFNASAEDIARMVAASAVSATLTTLLLGALSDKLGKRKVFISGGYLLWGISILAFALIRVDLISAWFPMAASASALCITLVIILDCVMTFFGSTANDAAFNAWLTDMTDHRDRGKVEGINAMMPLLSMLAVFGGFMSFDLSREESWTWIFVIIGVVVLIIGVLGWFLIEEPKLSLEGNQNYFANIVYGFRPSIVRQNPMLYLYLFAFVIFGISIQVFMPYLILYYTVTLQMEGYVLIMAPAMVLAAIFSVIWGRQYDKRGFVFAVFPSIGLLMIGYLLMYFCRGTALVFIGSLLVMCGFLAGSAAFGAIVRDRIPANRSGMFQGLRIVAQVLIPGVVGPMIGKWILRNADVVVNDDGTSSFIPSADIFLGSFVVALVLTVLLVILMPYFKKDKLHETN